MIAPEGNNYSRERKVTFAAAPAALSGDSPLLSSPHLSVRLASPRLDGRRIKNSGSNSAPAYISRCFAISQ